MEALPPAEQSSGNGNGCHGISTSPTFMADPETETSPSPTPSAAKPTWRRLLSPQKFPGYFIAIVGLGWKILDIGGRLDVFWQAVQVMGGDAALVAMIILSPYFSVSLILFGVLYVIFVWRFCSINHTASCNAGYWVVDSWDLVCVSVVHIDVRIFFISIKDT